VIAEVIVEAPAVVEEAIIETPVVETPAVEEAVVETPAEVVAEAATEDKPAE
jgi:hypothetical protein